MEFNVQICNTLCIGKIVVISCSHLQIYVFTNIYAYIRMYVIAT